MFNKLISSFNKRFFVNNRRRNNQLCAQLETEVRSRLLDLEEGGYLENGHLNSSATRQQKIANQVTEEGYVLIPNVFSETTVRQLREEFDFIINHSESCKYQVDKHEGSICVRVAPRHSLNQQRYPLTTTFFDLALFKQIATCFYNKNLKDLYFNSEIFVHETTETDQPLSAALHWDRSQTLKFWIFIDNIPLQAGPMRVTKKSGQVNRDIRIGKSGEKKILEGGVDNLVALDENNIVKLIGNAGTILIHDTDASHGSTAVKKGYTRRIMRGHTRLK